MFNFFTSEESIWTSVEGIVNYKYELSGYILLLIFLYYAISFIIPKILFKIKDFNSLLAYHCISVLFTPIGGIIYYFINKKSDKFHNKLIEYKKLLIITPYIFLSVIAIYFLIKNWGFFIKFGF